MTRRPDPKAERRFLLRRRLRRLGTWLVVLGAGVGAAWAFGVPRRVSVPAGFVAVFSFLAVEAVLHRRDRTALLLAGHHVARWRHPPSRWRRFWQGMAESARQSDEPWWSRSSHPGTFMRWARYRAEVRIAPWGALIGRRALVEWRPENLESSILDARLVGGERLALRIAWSQGPPRFARQTGVTETRVIELPVPPGREAEAETILSLVRGGTAGGPGRP